MKKYFGLFFLLIALLWTSNAFAGVISIIDSPSHTKRDNVKKITPPGSTNCLNTGYRKTSCGRSEEAVDYCPYNTRYFRYCCPAGYTHAKKDCIQQGMVPSKKSCHGYYACEYPQDY